MNYNTRCQSGNRSISVLRKATAADGLTEMARATLLIEALKDVGIVRAPLRYSSRGPVSAFGWFLGNDELPESELVAYALDVPAMLLDRAKAVFSLGVERVDGVSIQGVEYTTYSLLSDCIREAAHTAESEASALATVRLAAALMDREARSELRVGASS